MTEQTAPTKKRGPYAKTKAKRESIIAAALEVFAESGYYAGSLREIAIKADISEAGILHHFPTKASLLLAALETNDQTVRDLIRDAQNADFLHGLAHVAGELPKMRVQVEMHLRIAAEATAPSHPAHDYITARHESDRQALAEVFAEYDRAGRYRSELSHHDAGTLLIAVHHGVMLQWLLNPGAVDIPGVLRHQLALLVDLTGE